MLCNAIYFCYSTCNNKIQWTHPRTGHKKVIPKDLPFGWSKSTDENGKPLYIHQETGSKTSIDPRLAFAREEKKHVHDFRQRFDSSSTAFQVYLIHVILHKFVYYREYRSSQPYLTYVKNIYVCETTCNIIFKIYKLCVCFQVLHGIDLSGKYALITGCNAGIGYETAKSLARHGCNILMANRNIEASQKAIKQIVQEVNASEDNFKVIELDLSSLKSVKKCALAVKTVFSE